MSVLFNAAYGVDTRVFIASIESTPDVECFPPSIAQSTQIFDCSNIHAFRLLILAYIQQVRAPK